MTRRPLHLEALEDRLTPATFGFPWPDAHHLTVSFAPDGTAVGTGQSQLFSMMAAAGYSPAAWETQALRALQTWAVNADINFTVVPDSGDPLGTPGAPEGDPRFGDIRIAATPLSSGSVASSVPFSLEAGTWSGDILLNSNFPFSVGGAGGTYDLYSIVLHEAGHVLGVPDSTDKASPMFEYYDGVRTGLTAADVRALQALYGPRTSPGENRPGDDSWWAARDFGAAAVNQLRVDLAGAESPSDVPNLEVFSVAGDLTGGHDRDWFRYKTTSKSPGFTVRLETSDESLLLASLTVFDDEGHQVGYAVATDPQSGDLTVRVADAVHHDTYFIRVADAAGSDVFGVGAYRLRIVPDSPAALNGVNRVLAEYAAHPQANDTLATATALKPEPGSPPGHRDYSYDGTLTSAADVDYYRFKAPHFAAGTTGSLTVMVWSQEVGGAAPALTVYDASGNVLSATVVADGDGTYAVRLDGVTSGAAYFVRVAAADPTAAAAPGRYFLGAEFGAPPPGVQTVETGTITSDPAQQQQDFRSVIVPEAQLLHLELSVSAPPATVETSVEVTLYDLTGKVFYDAVIRSGQTVKLNIQLPAGTYTFRFVAGTKDGSPLTPTTYTIQAESLSDPIGPALVNPDGPPPPRNTDPQWLTGGVYNLLVTTDPYGNPIGGGRGHHY